MIDQEVVDFIRADTTSAIDYEFIGCSLRLNEDGLTSTAPYCCRRMELQVAKSSRDKAAIVFFPVEDLHVIRPIDVNTEKASQPAQPSCAYFVERCRGWLCVLRPDCVPAALCNQARRPGFRTAGK